LRNAALTACVLLAGLAARGQDAPVRDPMRPFQASGVGARQAAPPPRFALTAVLISPLRRVAVVNGQPYQQGDHVDGAQITLIEPNAVHLREGSNELVLRLRGAGRTAVKRSAEDGTGASAAAAPTTAGDPG
jgi:hypothetical protein